MTTDYGYRQVSRSAYAHQTGQPLNIFLGTCEIHDRPVRYEGGNATAVSGQPGKYRIWCPVPEGGASGHWMIAERLVAVTTTVTCDGSCMSARRPSCDCGCGGANHGRSWGVTATRQEFESALARYQAGQARIEKARETRRERAGRQAAAAYETWAGEHRGLLAALEAHRPDELGRPQPGSNGFLCDIARQALVHGKILTPGQVAAAERVAAEQAARNAERAARDAEIAERKANARPCPEGRVCVSGEIVKIKASEGYMPDSIRLQAVVACDGFAVMMTLPREVERWAMAERREQIWEGTRGVTRDYGGTDWDGVSRRWTAACRGVQIVCTATVERSGRDESFGFGKRPTKVTFDPAGVTA
jgi:hypothetical protein